MNFILIIAIALLLVENLRKDRKIAELKQQTVTDPLTGLHNRRYFRQTVTEETLCDCEGSTFMLTADIDHFKKINDTYGHTAGDYILKELSKILTKSVRNTDTVIRTGGEEFSITLYSASKKKAMEIAERIRSRVENYKFKFNGKQIKVTISIGLAEYEKGDTLEFLYKKSDRALYASKENGRNRITVFGDEK
jgi:diguanylate cyclase (GGDEF)-like protein